MPLTHEEKLERRKAYYDRKKQVLLPKQRQYYYKNKEAILAKQKEKYAENREQRRKAMAEYQKAHAENFKASVKKYRENNLEKLRENKRVAYRNKTPEEKERIQRRNAINRWRKGGFTEEEIEAKVKVWEMKRSKKMLEKSNEDSLREMQAGDS